MPSALIPPVEFLLIELRRIEFPSQLDKNVEIDCLGACIAQVWEVIAPSISRLIALHCNKSGL